MKFKWASDTFVCHGRRSEAGGEVTGQEAAQQPTAPSDTGTQQHHTWQQQEQQHQQQHQHRTHEHDRDHEQQHPTMVSLLHLGPIWPRGCVDPARVPNWCLAYVAGSHPLPPTDDGVFGVGGQVHRAEALPCLAQVGMDGSHHAAGQRGRETKMERDVGKGAMPPQGMMQHHLVQVKDEKGGDMHSMMSQQGGPRAHIPQRTQQLGLAHQQQSWVRVPILEIWFLFPPLPFLALEGSRRCTDKTRPCLSIRMEASSKGLVMQGTCQLMIKGIEEVGDTTDKNKMVCPHKERREGGMLAVSTWASSSSSSSTYNTMGGGHQSFSGAKQQSASGGDGQYFVPSKSGVIKSGWLHKKAATSWGWRKRWFILYPSSLHYCTSPDLKGIMKTISFSGMGSVEAVPSEFEFKIFCQGKCFVLKAETAGEKSEWLFAFQSVLGNVRIPPALGP